MNLSVFLDELQFFWGLGLLMEEVEFCDVFGLDEELLEMVPNPVLVVLFLYPITAKTEEERLQQENEKKDYSSKVYFTKQTVGNACGTISLLHALGNITFEVKLGWIHCSWLPFSRMTGRWKLLIQ
ncbi:ubiquitin carboxyl-terminal hydrolase 3-like isoform X2 [Vigna radiata var. radiata]|uniref:Ubiquitin carboxyl-terminal hydrolase n=1 Tax=Vigna radiata var. radiata TaxID=3916 RepID=A0A1S3TCG7_VIGRR|nr:ubiquitin carboxyl-terminal hydrolase 3-like isoform X2 [Vigna radiata var. radiata]